MTDEETPRPVYRNAAGERTVVLACPFDIGDEVVDRVTVRPPTLGDVQAWSAEDEMTNFALLAAMTGLSGEALKALRWPDAEAVLALAVPLLPPFMRQALAAPFDQEQ